MKKWKVYGTGLMTVASLCPDVRAQVPVAPAPIVPVAAAPVAPPATLWSFLGLTKDQKEAMKRKCCQTALGQLFGALLTPVRVFSGGVVGNFCPQNPTLADQAKPGPEGMAAKVQADEADAKARRAAVRYLGTVDCHYWPEVQDTLIGALRNDRNECVRFEAAMALGGGCCCTKKTIQALLISATGSNKDEFPPETCERVREAAMASLQHCLACFSQEVPAEPKKPEKPEAPVSRPEKPRVQLNGQQVQLTAFYQNLENKTLEQCVQETRQALGDGPGTFSPTTALPTGTRSMFNILANAFAGRPGRNGEMVVSVRPSGMENGTSQPEPIPLASFSAAPVPQAQPVEKKPLIAAPLTRILSKPVMPATPEPPPVVAQPAVAKPQAAPVPTRAIPLQRLVVPASQPAPVPQQQSRATINPDPEPYLAVLKRSIYPFQREWAVESLAGTDWQNHPEVLQAVLTSAKRDAAPTVRAECVRTLVRKHVATAEAMAVIQELRSDPDPRVVHEAVAALAPAGGMQQGRAVPSNTVATSIPSGQRSGIQPASFTVPARPVSSDFRR